MSPMSQLPHTRLATRAEIDCHEIQVGELPFSHVLALECNIYGVKVQTTLEFLLFNLSKVSLLWGPHNDNQVSVMPSAVCPFPRR